MKGIVWLASYPKSGNTWLRFWLANYLDPCEGGIPVDQLFFGQVASLRRLLDEWSGLESSDLIGDEVDAIRADAYRALAAHARRDVFLKIHDAWRTDAAGQAVFPPDATRLVLYVARHPFDVAVSLAHHLGVSPATAVDFMCDDNFELAAGSTAGLQLPQRVMSWSSHVRSWLESGLRLVTIRYEDMRSRPAEELSRVLRALGECVDEHRVAAAITHSSFHRLQQQERERGFPGRGAGGAPFFRHGREGAGLATLTAAELARLAGRHHEVMERLGYHDGGLL